MRRLVIALILIATACTPDEQAGTTIAPPPSVANAAPVVIDSVLDGDSIRVELDGAAVEVRLLGINAPERGECWADEARTALDETLSDAVVAIVGSEQDQYGRLLAYVYADGANVNREMIAAGDAIAMATDHDELPDFLAAEEEAVSLERGLWSPTVCGSSGEWSGVRIWAIEPDAAGRDDRNPNGEFVAITNEGPPIDIGGWTLRDESSVHRYPFPAGFAIDTGEIITVRSGCGDDARPDLYWCADPTVWTNSGDTVLLLDAAGAVVDRERYFGD